MENILKLYSYVDGANDAPFPSKELQIVISDFEYSANRMGNSPSIRAKAIYPTCLDDRFNEKVYAVFEGERYFLMNTPSSREDSSQLGFSHDLVLISEREILNHVYFYNAVEIREDGCFSSGKWIEQLYYWYTERWKSNPMMAFIGDDGVLANSTEVSFFGDIRQFAKRLKANLSTSRLGYNVVVDEGTTSEEKLFKIKDKYITQALQEMYKLYEIPYYFEGKTIHIGKYEKEVSHVMKYGVDDALMSVSKNNENNAIFTRVTGQGSPDNLPYYYPNETPKGKLEVVLPDTNKGLKKGDVVIKDMDKFCEKMQVELPCEYDEPIINVDHEIKGDTYVNGRVEEYKVGQSVSTICSAQDRNVYGQRTFDFHFELEVDSNVFAEFTFSPNAEYSTAQIYNKETGEVFHSGTLFKAGKHTLQITVTIDYNDGYEDPYDDSDDYVSLDVAIETLKISSSYVKKGWYIDKKPAKLEDLGLEIVNGKTPVKGDKIMQSIVELIQYSPNLMPPIYRESKGAERFYNAVNNPPYFDKEGKPYVFENEYSDRKRRESVKDFPDIKPTIKNVKNNNLQNIDSFVEFAYDEKDNGEFTVKDGEKVWEHPYFFAKLKKTDGDFGFNLFKSANEKQTMIVSMTTGNCGACQFEIGVGESTDKNTVQVDRDTNQLLRDENGDVRCGRRGKPAEAPQDWQQDTSQRETWIALKKDISTYDKDEPMPTVALRPSPEDKFVLLGISLPEAYIRAAEEELKKELIKYMYENNFEKFNFSIKLSRIFLKENIDVLKQLNENSTVKVEYNGVIHSLLVSEYKFKVNRNEILPEISVTLTKDVKIGQNSIQKMLESFKTEVVVRVLADEVYQSKTAAFARKDVDEVFKNVLTMLSGARFGDFIEGQRGARINKDGEAEVESLDARNGIVTDSIHSHNSEDGMLGKGMSLSTDPVTGKSSLQVDELLVRMKAVFTELEIRKMSHVGGNIIVSPASMKCYSVQYLSSKYRCFFMASDGQESVRNEFKKGDLVMFKEYNKNGTNTRRDINRMSWRECLAVGADYIDLSIVDGLGRTDLPRSGDTLITLGNRTDPKRQNAIIISSYGEKSPSIVQYQGINTFSLVGKDVTVISPYGNKFKGDFIIKNGSNIEDAINDSKSSINDINKKIQELESITDGAIEFFFGEEVPTLDNYPANEWTTPEIKEKHVADMYYTNDKSYRFVKKTIGSEVVYEWKEIIDSISKEALELAKSKSQVFVRTPMDTDEYKVGDLWVNATYGDYDRDILECINGHKANTPWSISDWKLCSKYTDDSKAIEALGKAEDAQNEAIQARDEAARSTKKLQEISDDNIITPEEKRDLRIEVDVIRNEYPANIITANQYGVDSSAYKSRFDTLSKNITPILLEPNTNSEIVRSEFMDWFTDYYDSRNGLLDSIYQKARVLANNAQMKADEAYNLGVAAGDVANAAKEKLSQWSEDGVISPTEKLSIKRELKALDSDYNDILKQVANSINSSEISTVKYTAAYKDYSKQLAYHSRIEPEIIVILPELATTQDAYYKERNLIIDKLTNAISSKFVVTDKSIEGAIQSITNIDGRVKKQETKLTEIDGEISATVSSIATIDKRVTETESRLSVAEKSISSSVSEITKINDSITSHETRIEQNASDISLNAHGISEVNNTVQSQESRLSIAEGKIASSVSDISEINGKVQRHETLIEQNANEITLAVKNVQVGGVNLYRSNTPISVIRTNGQITTNRVMSQDKNGFKIFGSAENDSYVRIYTNFQEAGDYTISFRCLARYHDWNFDVMGTYLTKISKSNVDIKLGSVSLKKGVKTDYLSFTLHVDKDNFSSNVDFWFKFFGSTEYEFTDFKIERGNKGTDWTPSPYDSEKDLLDTGINIKEKEITVTADSFKVRNNKGKNVAVFETTPSGEPVVSAERIDTERLQVSKLSSTAADGTRTEIFGGIIQIFGNRSNNPNIKIGSNADGEAIFKFYDKDGRETLNLSPKDGLVKLSTPYMDAVYLAFISNALNPSFDLIIEDVRNPHAQLVYQYQAGTIGGNPSLSGKYYKTKGMSGNIPTGNVIDSGWYTDNVGEPEVVYVEQFTSSDIKPDFAVGGRYYKRRILINISNGKRGLYRYVYWE